MRYDHERGVAKLFMRPHRGVLAEAMDLCVEIRSASDIGRFLQRHRVGDTKQLLRWELYHDQPDDRIGWEKTYIIDCGQGVVGFANFPLAEFLGDLR